MAAHGGVNVVAERMARMKELLTRCDEETKAMAKTLITFDKKLTDLNDTVKPIQDLTKGRKHAHAQLGNAILQMDEVFDHFKTADATRDTIRGNGVQTKSYSKYLEQLDLVQTSLKYFNSHPDYKCGASVRKELDELYNHGIAKCHQEFERVLRNKSRTPAKLEPFVTESGGKPKPFEKFVTLPDMIPTCTDEVRVALHTMCKRLHMSRELYSAEYLATYQKLRVVWVTKSLETAVPLTPTGAKFKSSLDAFRSHVSPTVRYIKGTHPFIHYTRACVKLIAADRKLAEDILIDEKKALLTCSWTVASAVDQVVDDGHGIAKLRLMPDDPTQLADQVLATADLYEQLRAQDGEWQHVCGPEEMSMHLDRFHGLRDTFQQVAKNCFKTFESQLQGGRFIAAMADAEGGTVHELTTTVVSYLRRLLDYGDTLGYLTAQEGHETHMDKVFLESLMGLERSIQEYYRGRKLELHIRELFLANNFFYVNKMIRDSSSMTAAVGPDKLTDLQHKVEMAKRKLTQVCWAHCAQNVTPSSPKGWPSVPEVVSNKKLKEDLKNRYKGFNSYFVRSGETAKLQVAPDKLPGGLTIPDPSLKEQLCRQCHAFVMPLYSVFHELYGAYPFQNPEKYIKYTPAEVEGAILMFFR